MNKRWSVWLVLPFFVGLLVYSTGHSQDESSEAKLQVPNWKEIQVPFTYQNMQVPRELWQNIKEILRSEGAQSEILDNMAVTPIALQVALMAQSPVVLREGQNYLISYVEGGGALDLFDYLSGKGPFHIRFLPELDPEQGIHLLYISDSPGKQMDGRTWGNGCGQIYDLSEQVNQFVTGDGIRLTSSRKQYLHLMAGTFVFFQLVAERLSIGYIQLNDSRYPNFNCQDTEA